MDWGDRRRALADLRAKRRALTSLRTAIYMLPQAGMSVPPQMDETWGYLVNAVVVVPTPCAICHAMQPVEVKVSDDGEPTTVLCQRCDDVAMEEVEQP